MLKPQDHVLITQRDESNTAWRIIKNEDWCQGGDFCYTFCPHKALTKSEKLNVNGYYPPIVAKIHRCVGCRIRGGICPDLAIPFAENLPKSK